MMQLEGIVARLSQLDQRTLLLAVLVEKLDDLWAQQNALLIEFLDAVLHVSQ